MNALDVARAACMEVGADESAVVWDAANEVLRVYVDHPDVDVALRAGWLGEQAEFGPNYLTHCQACFDARRANVTDACVPVRDALRGITCGRAS